MGDVLAELVARISADATQLKKGLAESEKAITGLGKTTDKETKSIGERFKEIGTAATVMGAAITASFGAMMLSFDRAGSELYDMALKTSISVEALAGLKYAAEQNGASLGTVQTAFRRLAMAMQDAKDGLLEAQRAFDRMGISIIELQGLTPEQQFLRVAEAIADIPDPMTRAATAMEIFGRSGMDMLPMLSAGATGLKAMMQEGQKLSGWTTENAKLADDFGDALMTLKTSISGTTNAIAGILAPALSDIAGMFTGIISKVAEFIKQHPELTKAIAGATLAMGLLAGAVGTVSLAVTYLGSVVNLQFGGILLIVGALVAAGIALAGTFKKMGDDTKAIIDPLQEMRTELEKTRKEATLLATEADTASKKAISALDKLGEATVEALKRRNKESEEAERDSLDKRLQEIRTFYEATEQKAQETHQTVLRRIESLRDKELDSIRENLAARQNWYDRTVELYEKEADKRLKSLRSTTNTQVKGIQSQIDAILAQRDVERKAIQDARDESRRRALGEEWRLAKSENNANAMVRISREMEDLESDIRKRALEETRQTEIDKLQAKIQAIRDDEKTKEEQIKIDLDRQKEQLTSELDAFKDFSQKQLQLRQTFWTTEIAGAKTNYEQGKALREAERKEEESGLKTELDAIIAHYAELNKEEVIQAKARKLILDTSQQELITLLQSYNPQWQDAGISFGKSLIDGLNSQKASIQATIADIMIMLDRAKAAQLSAIASASNIAILEQTAADIAAGMRTGGTTPIQIGGGGAEVTMSAEGMQKGGIVTRPTLILAGEQGPEIITPLGKTGLSIIFEGPVYGFTDFENKVAEAVKNHAIRGGFHGIIKGG